MISVFGSSVGEQELAEVRDSIDKSWLGMGKKVAEFESRFAEWRGLDYFLLVDSGSNALYMAVAVLDLPPGSEVIVPSFTWVSCAQAVILAGHRPVFCDVDFNSCNATAETIADKITDRTAAIMVVHYAGKPVDMDAIMALGYPVIEDAAHAVDSDLNGLPCGGIGDVGIYSFDAVKNLTTGEGGGITFRSAKHYESAKKMRYCGIGKSGFQQAQSTSTEHVRWWEYNISSVFIKMLPTDIAAGIGLAQLSKIAQLQEYRSKLWDIYQSSELQNMDFIQQPQEASDNERHSFFTYLIKTSDRDALAKYLLDNKVYTTLRYHPLHLNPIYGAQGNLINSEKLNECALNLPLHPNLSEADVHYIVGLISDYYNQAE